MRSRGPVAPKRIAVVGNGGTGKTTLALRLGELLQLPVFHTDSLLWRSGWQQAPDDEYDAAENAILARDAWVFDGLGAWRSLVRRVAAADAIVFPDYPLETALAWARRRVASHGDSRRPELAEGCPESAIEDRLYPLIEWVHAEIRPKLVALLADVAATKPVHVLAQPADMERFVAFVERSRKLPEPGAA